eukprot:PhF_6_TR43347/c0_g1_i1/m.66361/K08582/CAPN15; calpain-15
MGICSSKEEKPRTPKNVPVPTAKPAAAVTTTTSATQPTTATATEGGAPADIALDAPKGKSFKQQASSQQPLNDVTAEIEGEDAAAGVKKGAGEKKRFANGSPKLPANAPASDDQIKYSGIFKDGLLYSIQYDVEGATWWVFYNDTTNYEMTVTYNVGPRSQIRTDGVATRTKRSVLEDKWISCSLVLNPGETDVLFVGKPNGLKATFNPKPVSAQYLESIRKQSQGKVGAEVNAVRELAKVPADAKVDDAAVLEQCVASHIPYVDLNFPPQQSSLYREFEAADAGSCKSVATWSRPQEYLQGKEQPTLIKGKAEPNDIDQGSLGDCWFLCSIASVAEYEDRVKAIFRHPHGPEQQAKEEAIGAYHVRLNKHGWYQDVIVDSYLPVSGNGPVFARNREERGELWVSLLEKAYAKVHGSYASIVGGDALEGLADLTGAPTIRLDKEWIEAAGALSTNPSLAYALFDKLVKYDQADYLLTMSTPGQDDSSYMGNAGSANTEDFTKRYQSAGLGMGHAYSLIEVRHFPAKNLRLIKVRNPWGNGVEWTGRWGDSDKAWKENPDVQEACKKVDAADGTFWMAIEDALKWFDGCGVCCLTSNMHDYRVQGKYIKGLPNVALKIQWDGPNDLEVYLTLSRNDTRGLPEDDPAASTEAQLLHLCQSVSDKRMQIITNASRDLYNPGPKWTFTNARDQAMKVTLKPSKLPYFVIANSYGKKPTNNQSYVLGIISPASLSGKVTFVKPGDDLQLFKNYPQSDIGNGLLSQPVNAMYQIKTDSAVVTKEGTSVA